MEDPPEDAICFTGGMWDTILNSSPSTSFDSLTATSMLASLGEVEGWQPAEGIRSVKIPKQGQAGEGSYWVRRMQMLAGVLTVGADRSKTDKTAQCSAPGAMEARAAVYQVWEAPTARDTGSPVRRLHGAHNVPSDALSCFEIL